MESVKMDSVKIFHVKISADLHVLSYPESKKVFFENWSMRTYVCVCTGRYSALCISKTNKDIKTKFYTQYQIIVQMIFPGFG